MIKFNEKRIPEFVKVNSIEFSILPPISNNFLTIRGKSGSYHMSRDVGNRVFTVNISIISEKINGVMSASREVAEWLNTKEPVKLVIDDEPDKYYLAIFDGDSNISESLNLGQGTLSFVCTSPYAFGDEKVAEFEINDDLDTGNVLVESTADVFPVVDLTVKEPISYLTVETNEGTIQLGEPQEVSQTLVNPEPPLVLIDELEQKDLTNWTRAYQVDGGDIEGELSTNNYSFRQENKDYGEGGSWHGASMIQELDKPLQDFRIHMGFIFKHTARKQVGRIEMYLLDENNVQFGKIAMVDRFTNAERFVLEGRAGTWGEGTYFASGKHMDDWHNGYGRIVLIREGRNWTISTSPKINGRYDHNYEVTWFDAENRWNHRLAKIQIHIGTYGNDTPLNDMAISHIVVRERIQLDMNTQAPYIATTNDVISIDNERMYVYLNNEPRFDLINPASNFFKFTKGDNPISISPATADVKVSYNERWL